MNSCKLAVFGVIESIKAQSRVHSRVFQYVGLNELYNATYAAQNPFPTWYKQVAARNWWLHPSTTAGNPVTDPQSSQKWLVDMAPQVPVDPTTALGPYGWAAKYVNDLFHLGHVGTTYGKVVDLHIGHQPLQLLLPEAHHHI